MALRQILVVSLGKNYFPWTAFVQVAMAVSAHEQNPFSAIDIFPSEVPMRFFPEFKDKGEIVAWFGDAKLIRFLDGKTELRGGSSEDRTAAREWISMFWHEAVPHDREPLRR